MAKSVIVTPKLHPKLAKWKSLAEKSSDLQDVIATPSLKLEYINSGSTVLNLLLGGSRMPDGSFVCPGYMKGGIIEIFGRESSGKSTLALTAMAHAIAQNGGTGCGLYVDLEHAVKDHYAMKLGCDFRPPELGGSGQAIRVQPHTFEETETLVDIAALNGVDLIVIDSVAGFISRREISRDISNEKEKLGIGEVARLMSGWMPKLQSIIARTKTCVIFLNQTRDKIGAKGFSEEALKTTPGGNALKFWASNRLFLKPLQSAKAKRYNPVTKENEEVQIATDILVKNIKNKIDARMGHTGVITLRYGVGIDELRTMLNIGEAYKLIKKTKNSRKQDVFTYSSEQTGEVIEAVGIEKFRSLLTQNHALCREFNEACVNLIIEGMKSITDEEVSQMAENTVYKSVEPEDGEEYDDDGPPNIVSMEEMGESEDGNDSISAGPEINASDL